MATTKTGKTSTKKSAEKSSGKAVTKKNTKSIAKSTSKKTVKKAPASAQSAKTVKGKAKSASKKASSNRKTTNKTSQNAPTKKRAHLIMMLKERLLEERDAILRGLHLKKAEGEISTHGDLVDQSTNFSEQEVILGLAEHDRNRLQDINRALNKIEDGTYGICEMSGKLISDERLVAIPTARYSVECQAKVEGFG